MTMASRQGDQPVYPNVRPRDAATLIIVKMDAGQPRVLLGQRHSGHAFMPNKFVFPGGRVDAGDCRVRPGEDLNPVVAGKLLKNMRGIASPNRARGLAMAAVRETFEETGLIVGMPWAKKPATKSTHWKVFFETGYVPDLAGLRLVARAITPPGRIRRFDTRFFVVNASAVANMDAAVQTGSDELLDPHWFSFDEAAELDLPRITGVVLKHTHELLKTDRQLSPDAPAFYQRVSHRKWRTEEI